MSTIGQVQQLQLAYKLRALSRMLIQASDNYIELYDRDYSWHHSLGDKLLADAQKQMDKVLADITAVSYTHLTLPTKLLV